MSAQSRLQTASRRARRSTGRWPMAACAAACIALAGCAGTPSVISSGAPGEGAASAASPTSLAAFEAMQRQDAQAFEREGRLADAAWAWEVLTVLRPDNAAYRESLASVRRQIDAGVTERLQHAQQAQKRGELDAAATQYLMVLSLQPDHAQAADALRAIERERNKRTYLGKLSRITLARRTPDDKPPALTVRSAADRNELEHASLLAAQGELDDAIALMERRVAADRRDAAARQMLADLYVQKADKLVAHNNRPAAIAALQKGVRLNPAHPRARALLKQLQAEAGPAAGTGEAAGTAPSPARSAR